MPDEGPSRSTASDRGAIPAIEYDVLDRIGQRLEGSSRFEAVEFRPPYAPDSLVVAYDVGYYPAAVERAYLRVRWFVNGDFNIHYSEQYGDGEKWECRWDRHPNEHNARDHFHPPPSAGTPGQNEEHPDDWRDVLSVVLRTLDARVESFW